jgi:hypothetical protein
MKQFCLLPTPRLLRKPSPRRITFGYHQGSCRQCGAHYAFETSTVRGFADFIEAKWPNCEASLGEFREDVDLNGRITAHSNEIYHVTTRGP